MRTRSLAIQLDLIALANFIELQKHSHPVGN